VTIKCNPSGACGQAPLFDSRSTIDGVSWLGRPVRIATGLSQYTTQRPRRFVVNCGDDSATSSGDMRSNLFQAERLAAVNAFAAHGYRSWPPQRGSDSEPQRDNLQNDRAPAPPANARELF
jgi:hypothetical protein